MTLYTGYIVVIMLFSSLLRSGALKFAAKFKFIYILNNLPICIYALYLLLFFILKQSQTEFHCTVYNSNKDHSFIQLQVLSCIV